ncbi:Uncharacterized protein dnm_019790 [Desulfonema magnum]|uniref:Uncharacterized protein n=1 Tax=Desulfonema magnum TaxID=45655 RepID=A0A975GLN4_9BACT|nr:Uncharacterized protein dnm_019790 [Desulfonema magnum]
MCVRKEFPTGWRNNPFLGHNQIRTEKKGDKDYDFTRTGE